MRRVIALWRRWLLCERCGVVLILRTEVRHAAGKGFVVGGVECVAECSILSEYRTYLVLNTAMSR